MRTVGHVVSYRVENGELLVSVRLTEPIEAEMIDRNSWVGEFRYGIPLGTKIEPRFDGRRQDGIVEISILDRNVAWKPGVMETNGPLFLGKALTLPS